MYFNGDFSADAVSVTPETPDYQDANCSAIEVATSRSQQTRMLQADDF